MGPGLRGTKKVSDYSLPEEKITLKSLQTGFMATVNAVANRPFSDRICEFFPQTARYLAYSDGASMISNKSYYGIAALVHLAINARGGHVGVKDIATSQSIPLRFLELIFSRLKAGEIVTSVRGAGGGYYLARPPEQITLADVIFACEGTSEFVVPAALSERMNSGDPVGKTLVLIINKQLENLRDGLRSMTLADVIQSAGLSSEMYWI